MNDIAYRLIVDMSSRGSLGSQLDRVGAQAKGVDGAFRKIADSAAGLGRTFADSFTGVVESVGAATLGLVKLGAVAGAGAAAYGVAHLNNELEKTQISLAAIFGANDQTKGMQEGMLKASSVMSDMRKDAAALPGEFKDLIGIFRNASIPGFQAGQSIDQLRAMSAKVMAAAAVTGVPMEQAAREFAMLMEGRAGSHNVLGLRLAGLGGDKAEAFNKSTGAKRVEVLNKALEKFAPAIDTYATSFDGLSSTMLDNAKRFAGVATAGLFERVKIAMKDGNDWFDRHQTSALAFADRIGERLNYAFDFGRSKIIEWTPTALTFIHTLENGIVGVWERVEPIIERLEPKVKAALTDPHLFDKIEHVAKLYGAVKLGGMGASTFGPMMGAIGGLGGGEGALAAIGGIGPAALVAAPALVAVAGAIHVLSDETSAFHATASESWKQTQANVGQATAEATKAFDEMKPALTNIADVIGTATLLHLNALSAEIGFVATIANEAGSALFGFGEVLKLFKKTSDQEPIDAARQAFEPMSLKVMDALADQRILLKDGEQAKTKKGAGGGGGGTNIQKVEIVVSGVGDPSRVARLVEERLMDRRRFPTSSANARNFSAAR